MQQVGKRTTGSGNSGSYYSGNDHSNHIKLCQWSTSKKCKIWISNWRVDTLDSVRTSYHFGFEFVAFVIYRFLMHQKDNFWLVHKTKLRFYREVDFRGMGHMSRKNVADVTFLLVFSTIFRYQCLPTCYADHYLISEKNNKTVTRLKKETQQSFLITYLSAALCIQVRPFLIFSVMLTFVKFLR